MYWIKENSLPLFFVALLVGVMVFLGVAIYYDGQNKDRLMKQCMDDGHKEYECYSAIKKESPTQGGVFFIHTGGR